jgi:short subunit fatty acids transporter
MENVISLTEMQRLYNGEWVLIVNASLDQNLEVVSGKVVAHSPDVESIYRALALTKGVEASIEYIGQVPDDFAAIL